jgi:phosphomannomutase/phosphoglucomutase
MTESKATGLNLPASLDRLRSLPWERWQRLLRGLAVLAALLAAWFAWEGVNLVRQSMAESQIDVARDAAVSATASLLSRQREKLATLAASAGVQQALASGDTTAVRALIGKEWPRAEQVDLLDTNLDALYGALPSSGYGKLGLLESVLAEGKPLTRVITDAGGPRLALATAVPGKHGPAALVYVRQPLQTIGGILQEVDPGNGYLSLRQGTRTLVERGDASLADGAEVHAMPVPDSNGLRIAAAMPELAGSLFGSIFTAAIATVLMLLAALAAWKLPGSRWLRPTLASAEGAEESTFAETLGQPASTMDAPGDGHAPAAPAPPVIKVAEPSKAAPVAIDRGIFRAYDIRGVVGKTLDAGVASLIGQAVGSLMAERNLREIVVGRDGRASGPALSAALIDGLRRAGRDVIDIGLAATPLVYFAGYHLRTGSGIAVTGSHNPADYNGFKIVVGGETLAGDAVADLYARIAEDRLHDAPEPGTLQSRSINDDYLARIASDVQIDRPLRVVVDAGNGVAGAIAPQVLEAIGAEVIPLFCEVDGTFPNHHPDPGEPENLKDLELAVKQMQADLGVAFDGDGDRLGVVTPSGRMIFPDRLLMLFAADVLERNPGAMVVYDVKCSGRLAGEILRHGGSPLMWKTGHSLIKAKMRETDAELAGEMSGHFFFKERWYGFDDGIYAACRLLEILAARNEAPGAVLDALPQAASTPEIKVPAPEDNPHGFVSAFVAKARFEGARISTIDGLRVDWPDGWGLVRASNTTPVLVMRFEGDNDAAMARVQAAFREQLLALRPDLALPF